MKYMIVTRFMTDTGQFAPSVYKSSEGEFMVFDNYAAAKKKADELTEFINRCGYEGQCHVVLEIT